MKMRKIALAVAVTVSTSSAFAVELYNSGGTTFSVGGYLDAALEHNGGGTSTNVDGVSPRINVVGTQNIGNGLTVEAKGEWQVNLMNGGDNTFDTRLGYVALHTPAGKIKLGSQWSPFYQISGVADQPILYANNYLYEGGRSGSMYRVGNGRAERMLSYQNTFDINKEIELYVGLAWQGKRTYVDTTTNVEQLNTVSIVRTTGVVTQTATTIDMDNRGQVAASIDYDEYTLGLAYMGGDVNGTDADITSVSLSYGTYAKGLYLAANYGRTHDFYGFYDANQYSGLAAYGMENGINWVLYYERVEHDHRTIDSLKIDYLAPQIEYYRTTHFAAFVGYQAHLGSNTGDNQWGVGMRYYF
ncbi:porin [Vibrio sp. SM6]|uniref:Porin n=1 Tax=Vibrio agarilyticus TaxID=2726741 RepID=A0A7X8TNN9_9VIBR|nr:porin [Vibrio agarilyticus]NLS12081.1 porin [Vibrio agarilyticus]